MSRKSARVKAFEFVFQMSFREPRELETVLDVFFRENIIKDKDKTYICKVIEGVFENKAKIDGLIKNKSKRWDNDRIGRVDMAIMRIGIYEMLEMSDIPVNVSINEAVELAKLYGGDDSPSFINGILGAVERELDCAQ